MIGYPVLSNEFLITRPGHTMSLMVDGGYFRGYLGHVDFGGVYAFSGSDVGNLQCVTKMPIVPDVRTASAVFVDGRIVLFVAKRADVQSPNIYRHQEILMFEGDGLNFVCLGKVDAGSAPFVYAVDGDFYLYYHKLDNRWHYIVVRTGKTIGDLMSCKEAILLKEPHSFSMPSMAMIGGSIWLTCEEMRHSEWKTALFEGKAPAGPFVRTNDSLLQHPCAHQFVFGNRLIVTFSVLCEDGVWELRAMEGQL